MKRLIILLLLLMMVSVTPTHAVDEQYYLYPAIGYIGVSTDLPSGEMVEWVIDCTIFFEEIEMQDMIPTSDSIIDKDKYIARSFTFLEMFNVRISYCVRFFIHHSTLYLWNGELVVDEQTIEEMPYDEDSWVQYKCWDVSGDWSIGFYAATSGNIRTIGNGMLMASVLLFLGVCVVIMTKKGYHWIAKQREGEEWVRNTFVH